MENKIDFHLGFTYNERRRPSLVGVEGHIGAGKFVVLCGCSGCGKSTLLRCINHLIPEFYEGSSPAFVGSMAMISRIAASGLWENRLHRSFRTQDHSFLP